LILEPPTSVQKLRTALQVKAKEKPDYRFYLLYDKYREDVLACRMHRSEHHGVRDFAAPSGSLRCSAL
jgi:hypothetical protein